MGSAAGAAERIGRLAPAERARRGWLLTMVREAAPDLAPLDAIGTAMTLWRHERATGRKIALTRAKHFRAFMGALEAAAAPRAAVREHAVPGPGAPQPRPVAAPAPAARVREAAPAVPAAVPPEADPAALARLSSDDFNALMPAAYLAAAARDGARGPYWRVR